MRTGTITSQIKRKPSGGHAFSTHSFVSSGSNLTFPITTVVLTITLPTLGDHAPTPFSISGFLRAKQDVKMGSSAASLYSPCRPWAVLLPVALQSILWMHTSPSTRRPPNPWKIRALNTQREVPGHSSALLNFLHHQLSWWEHNPCRTPQMSHEGLLAGRYFCSSIRGRPMQSPTLIPPIRHRIIHYSSHRACL